MSLVRDNERMLTGGFYAEIDLGYDAAIAEEKGGRPFQVNTVRPVQLSTRGILDRVTEGRTKLSTEK
jgi:ATP-dependent Lon protease